jgi:hypothetical protein
MADVIVHVLCSPFASCFASFLLLPRVLLAGRQCSFGTGRETGQKSGPTDPIGAKIIVYLKSSNSQQRKDLNKDSVEFESSSEGQTNQI